MEEQDAAARAGANYIPAEIQREAFSASGTELVFSLLSFLAGWCYAKSTLGMDIEDRPWYLLILAGILVFTVEYLHREKKRSFESMLLLTFFISCTAALALRDFGVYGSIFAYPYHMDRIWDWWQVFLFVHIFFVWYVMSRSGKLLEGETGHLLPADMLNAFVIIPVGNLFLRIRTLLFGAKKSFSRNEKEGSKPFPWMSVLAVILSMGILVAAVSLLMQADDRFNDIFEDIYDFFYFEPDEIFMVQLVFSIPVGAWLWGLMGGSFRYREETLVKRREGIYALLTELRKVPSRVWTLVIVLFSAVYALFFAIQGNYLFSAFFGRLPEGFIVSQYARKGFFELCKVMALNFLLLWCATRSADEETRESKGFKTACVALLAESMLLSAVSISKLCLYISSFGITPLRLQSSWLAAVLFAGCVAWMYSLLTGKKVFKYWMYFGAVTLTVMAVI
ncbi:MAG: DUF4173 domain-containing protein [Firmicutes bacterium]|nr:DUF4173 domain-containing protein [Bacillota bacterium]